MPGCFQEVPPGGRHRYPGGCRGASKGVRVIESANGSGGANGEAPLELEDAVVFETNEGESIEFKVVGLVEDDEHNAYAVCYSESADEFVVTDAQGNLLSDEELAQEILEDFQVLAEEAAPESEG